MKVAVVSNDYPGPDLIYGDCFVHFRVKMYQSRIEGKVFGFNPDQGMPRIFNYEGVDVNTTPDENKFVNEIKAYDPDVIAVHLLQHYQIDALLSFGKPLVIFIHGHEALSWERRLMNYRALGDLRYLWSYFKLNRKQLKAMRSVGMLSNSRNDIHFVFVSNWLHRAVESDWKMRLKNSHIVPNGIDTSLFQFRPKDVKLRKRILLLRSFKARNYANDLAIEAILLLSKKKFFSDLDFSIYGEGYLFPVLTEKIRHFPNIQLNNFFVENKNIPGIHAEHGIFLCPSRLDTQGVSMCEAMASGLVPITSPIGGISEYATDNVSSFQATSAQEIAGKIEYLYNQPDVFLKMSEEARLAIATKCSLPDTAQKEMDLFQSLAVFR